jgi:outer membrane protein OmpA-like peptidoglycan-associated protein
MMPHRFLAALAILALAAPAARAGLGDALKKKLDKATKKVEETTDKAKPKADDAPAADAPAEKGEGKPAGDKVATVSTKFDYVPGDSVLFLDDFTGDDLGEFPAHWKLVGGTFEVAEMNGERWLRGMSPDGRVRLKLPFEGPLPDLWTLDLDLYGTEPMAAAFSVRALGDAENEAWEAVYPHDKDLAFRSGDIYSTTPLENSTVAGRHHMSFMARGKSIKAYMDRQRLANVPEIVARAGAPRELEIRLWAQTKPMITNVRFAQGPRPAKDLLAGGKLVTHGILFASGSDVVLPESAPILRQVASWMEANPAVKLKVTGHTDNVGTPASNLDLSKRRSAAVATVLSTQLGVDAGRFVTDGKGDTQALASNARAEGRAMNRRVEFAKVQ